MEQIITVTSTSPTQDFFTETEDWAVCRGTLEEYFELEDKPLELTFTLSTKPSEESYPIQITSYKLKIHLSDGTLAFELAPGFTYRTLLRFSKRAGRLFDALVHISVV